MKHLLLIGGLLVLATCAVLAQDSFQLAPPFLRYTSVFFDKEAVVNMEFAQADTHIHYTLNGQEPTEKDPVYTRPLVLKKHFTTLKAKVFGAGFLPSDVMAVTFFQKGLSIEKISHTAPNERYGGSGAGTLIDGVGGVPSNESKTWMGFQDTVWIMLTLKKTQKVKQLLLHVLKDQGAWIFSPQQIDVYCAQKDSGPLVLIGAKMLDAAQKDATTACQAILLETDTHFKTTEVVVKIYPLARIPEWHAGKGKLAWLFMDEVKLY